MSFNLPETRDSRGGSLVQQLSHCLGHQHPILEYLVQILAPTSNPRRQVLRSLLSRERPQESSELLASAWPVLSCWRNLEIEPKFLENSGIPK